MAHTATMTTRTWLFARPGLQLRSTSVTILVTSSSMLPKCGEANNSKKQQRFIPPTKKVPGARPLLLRPLTADTTQYDFPLRLLNVPTPCECHATPSMNLCLTGKILLKCLSCAPNRNESSKASQRPSHLIHDLMFDPHAVVVGKKVYHDARNCCDHN